MGRLKKHWRILVGILCLGIYLGLYLDESITLYLHFEADAQPRLVYGLSLLHTAVKVCSIGAALVLFAHPIYMSWKRQQDQFEE